ncbi:MAG: hypothetical protein AB7O43_05585 [Hyphomicrobiaceae bacterium]
MIAHVAQAGEDRGRVVLQMGSRHPSPVALDAAFRIARAFESEIECLFVEDAQLFDVAAYSFVREIPLSGRQSRALTAESVGTALANAAAGARRQIERLGRLKDVAVRCNVVRDETLHALAIACTERGPWNVIALAEPVGSADGAVLRRILDEVDGATGVVLVGHLARAAEGPVVLVVEQVDTLPGMLRTAQRLVVDAPAGIVVLLVATDELELHDLDAHARLAIGGMEGIRIINAEVARDEPAVVAEALRRLSPGFVIGQFGGLVMSDRNDLRPIFSVLRCPLLLVR